MDDDLWLHWLDTSGWATAENIDSGTRTNGHIIRMRLETVQRNFQGRPVRAVDKDGRIYDMLPGQDSRR